MLMMMMMIIIIMAIESVEQRPGWGEHVKHIKKCLFYVVYYGLFHVVGHILKL